jgi:predicted membrane protein (TIGR00267 family)
MRTLAFRRADLLPIVLGLSDGILTALTLAAGRLTNEAQSLGFSLGLRVAAAALISSAFVFFVARYSELRGQLINAERQLNLTTHGQFAASRLGHAVLVESIRAALLSSLSSFVGALFPLAIAALLPSFRWAAVVAALVVLAGLGAGLARSVHGSWARWSLVLVVGGVLLTFAGIHLRIL